MIMDAIVLDVQRERLLVLDTATQQRVVVNTPDARWYRPGDLIRIWYNGVMTNSIPPQIFASVITMVQQGAFPPTTCPPTGCQPVIRPPVVLPPVIFPPVFFPPVVRPPMHRPPHNRPPGNRPPHNRPGRPR